MKVLEHGKHFIGSKPVEIQCDCGCKMEVHEGDLEGGSTPFVWCAECKEPVFLPVKVVRDITVVRAGV